MNVEIKVDGESETASSITTVNGTLVVRLEARRAIGTWKACWNLRTSLVERSCSKKETSPEDTMKYA